MSEDGQRPDGDPAPTGNSSPAEKPAPSGRGGQLRSVIKIALLDVAAPLLAYRLFKSAGLSTVSALILSGVFPAIGVIIDVIQHRRLDAVGALVLAGIIAGSIVGLVSGNPRLVLPEGSVPTGIFGLVALGSLLTARPLMYRIALEFTGPGSAQGQEMTGLWSKHHEFRHLFRVITAVWGAGFLVEAALRVVIVENTSTGTALAISKVMPFVVAGILAAWTAAYGTYQRRKNEGRTQTG
ncbi:MAG: hypothetical protein JO016_10210 [Actinobacteria bacterium]|nr:hypothetical protein [Actinomycetota bacterium]